MFRLIKIHPDYFFLLRGSLVFTGRPLQKQIAVKIDVLEFHILIINMPAPIKLLLYSLQFTSAHAAALTRLVDKDPEEITFALIENAADVEPGSEEWRTGFRDILSSHGYKVEPVDLRNWIKNRDGLYEKLKSKDVIWLGGGNTFYLRWILQATGADSMISELVNGGKVYAGWSAGAIVAGPTLQHFDNMDDPQAAGEILLKGLELTDVVVVPHRDNEHFREGANKTYQQLKEAGYNVWLLTDNEAVVINGKEQKII